MGPTSGSPTCGPGRGQPREELAHGRAARRVAPVRGHLRERAQHEVAPTKGGMRHDRPRPAPDTAGPEDDVEIEHARAPAAPGAAAEGALDRLELGEQGVGEEVALDD